MTANDWRWQLECGRCDWLEVLDRQAAEDRLRGQGMLRRSARPSMEELLELLDAVAPRMVCAGCRAVGLIAGPCEDDDEQWGWAPVCEGCGRAIARERLEILPETKLCAACQQAAEQTGRTPSDETDYCPRCGASMQLVPTGGRGTSRYSLRCMQWPRCRGQVRGETRS